MKKSVQLFLVLGVCASLNAQQKTNEARLLPVNHPMANQAVPAPKYKGMVSEYAVPFSNVFKKNATVASPSHKTQWTWYSEEEIGQTTYDYQTNGSIKNHIINGADGKIGAVFTVSTDLGDTYDDRGTGYNFFNGTTWTGGVANARIEGDRVGYTNVVHTTNGTEVVLAHNTNKIRLHRSYRTKGTGSWTSDTILKSPHGPGNWWPQMTVGGPDGESIHVISITYPFTDAIGSTTEAPYKGQVGALLYSRSLDAGLTWDKKHVVLPLIDSTYYRGFSAEDYVIEAKGSTIVIVAGGWVQDVVMLKSTDNGDTWTKTIIQQFPLSKYDDATTTTDIDNNNVADTIACNDGSIAALIDNTDIVHVFFGSMKVLTVNPGTGTDQGMSYFPYTDGLYHWKEGATAPTIIATVKDQDASGKIEFYDAGSGVLPFGSYVGNSLTSYPSAGVDASNNIYVGYSSIAEWTYNGVGKSYRHQYVMRSDNQGTSWWPALDVTENYQYDQSVLPTVEGVFGCLAKRVDTDVHLVYQRDDGPGVGLPLGNSGGGPDQDDNTTINSIVYVKVPTDNLKNDVGVPENKSNISSAEVYPNPASGVANLLVKSVSAGTVNVVVSNILGQQLDSYSKSLVVGNNLINIDVEQYHAGVYFVKTSVGNSSLTTKLIVE